MPRWRGFNLTNFFQAFSRGEEGQGLVREEDLQWIRDWGFDLGYFHAGSIVWGVIAPGDNVAPGSLAGDYTGAGAGGSAGIGVKVNLLFGGDDGKISLQPLQVEGNVGIGANVGVTRLTLVYGQ